VPHFPARLTQSKTESPSEPPNVTEKQTMMFAYLEP